MPAYCKTLTKSLVDHIAPSWTLAVFFLLCGLKIIFIMYNNNVIDIDFMRLHGYVIMRDFLLPDSNCYKQGHRKQFCYGEPLPLTAG